MRPIVKRTFQWLGLALALTQPLVPTANAAAEPGRLDLKSLDHLGDASTETIVSLDGKVLELAGRFLSDKDPDEAKAREIISGLKGIYVRSYEFDKEGEIRPADVEAVRSQLRAPNWNRFIQVREKKAHTEVELYMLIEGDKNAGLAILSVEPKELTVVNIVGPIDIEKLGSLSGQFGIPDLDVGRAVKEGKDSAKEAIGKASGGKDAGTKESGGKDPGAKESGGKDAGTRSGSGR